MNTELQELDNKLDRLYLSLLVVPILINLAGAGLVIYAVSNGWWL